MTVGEGSTKLGWVYGAYTCDWPAEGNSGACGAPAHWFLQVDHVHRPLCPKCIVLAAKAAGHPLSFEVIEKIDPNRVPYKPPTQIGPSPHVLDDHQAPSQVVEEAPAEEDPLIAAANPEPPRADEHEEPSLLQALNNLAVSLLQFARETIEELRKGSK